MSCEWPSCKKERFLSEVDFTLHLRQHCDGLRANFVAPGACQWPGCSSKPAVRTRSQFSRHVNVHVKTVWCKFAECKHMQGFASKSDLKRHVQTVHSKEHVFKCPDSSCFSHTQGYSRKDKFDEHIQDHHPDLMSIVESLRCNVRGCAKKTAFQTEEELGEHFRSNHTNRPSWYCPVKGCTEHPKKYYVKETTVRHIWANHNCTHCIYDHCAFGARKDLVAQHILRHHPLFVAFGECRLPGCEGSRSQFDFDLFLAHLSDHHNIKARGGGEFAAFRAAKKGDTTYFGDGKFVACTQCSKSNTQSGQNEG